MLIDYYQILGLKRDATPEEIKQAYRRLAVRYHPDKNPNNQHAEERFREITEAYHVLGSSERKRSYDRTQPTTTSRPRNQRRRPSRSPRQSHRPNISFDKLNDLFGSIFERNRRRYESTGPSRGQDITHEVKIGLEEVVEDCRKRLRVRYTVSCRHCFGSGVSGSAQVQVCSQCRGTGTISVPHGKFLTEESCPTCQGEGQITFGTCHHCQGKGERDRMREIRIKIPAGSRDGTRLRFRGEGQPGFQGGPPGDLYVVVRLDSHRFLKRRGDDVHCEVAIEFKHAILGTTLRVATLDGHAKLVIPAGTQPGQVFKLKGMGFERNSGFGRGDQFVHIQISIPKSLTDEQRRLIEHF